MATDGEVLVEAMADADPDLDPVWGLLLGAAPVVADPAGAGAGGAPTTNAVVVTGEMGEVEELFEEEEAEKAEVEVDESKSKPISNVVDKAEVLPDMFPLMPECETAVSRSEIPGCDAFVLDNVLTKEECEAPCFAVDFLEISSHNVQYA